jgi:hypothetical protein
LGQQVIASPSLPRMGEQEKNCQTFQKTVIKYRDGSKRRCFTAKKTKLARDMAAKVAC